MGLVMCFLMNRAVFILSVLFSLAMGVFSTASLALPQIKFTEYKILLTEKTTASEYRILNQGDASASCSVSFIDYLISPDGQLSIPQEGEKLSNSASSFLRASPSRVLVPVNGSQKVKIVARGIRGLADGEWHSYLSIRCKEEDLNLQDGVNLVPNFVFNIPVTVRKGELSAVASIEDAKLVVDGSNAKVNLNLVRTGNRSLYGDFEVLDSAGMEIGKLKGISHYIQTSKLPVSLSLNSVPQGSITVIFTEDKRFGGSESTSVIVN